MMTPLKQIARSIPTMFVDVDGTLILWSGSDPGKAKVGEIPRLNLRVIDLMRDYKKKGGKIVVWSYGGKSYAQKWVDEIGINDLVDECIWKPFLYIDDRIDTVFNRQVLKP